MSKRGPVPSVLSMSRKMTMSEPAVSAISTDALTKSYDGVAVLKALNINIRQHSICGFLGPNGAGKTTTIKLLLGLAKPTAGGGTIFGQDIVTESTEIRRRVGYLSQDPRYYDHMTARETLRFTARFFYRGSRAAIEDRVDEVLELVGLANKADRSIKGFSGGERQRLGIAQALVNRPELLILDEPAASLDPMGRRDVLEVMERLRKQTTIFYSTHILGDVQRVSDTVVILNHGELIAEAPIGELLSGAGTGGGPERGCYRGPGASVGAALGRRDRGGRWPEPDLVAGQRDRRGRRRSPVVTAGPG